MVRRNEDSFAHIFDQSMTPGHKATTSPGFKFLAHQGSPGINSTSSMIMSGSPLSPSKSSEFSSSEPYHETYFTPFFSQPSQSAIWYLLISLDIGTHPQHYQSICSYSPEITGQQPSIRLIQNHTGGSENSLLVVVFNNTNDLIYAPLFTSSHCVPQCDSVIN